MKKLTSTLLALVAALFLLTTSLQAKGAPTGTWSGTLIDKHCGQSMAADPAGHDKACAMKCAKNGKGLGMVVDGKWYAFDPKGEKLAYNLLKSSTATSNIQVTVNGKLSGDKITIKKITPKA